MNNFFTSSDYPNTPQMREFVDSIDLKELIFQLPRDKNKKIQDLLKERGYLYDITYIRDCFRSDKKRVKNAYVMQAALKLKRPMIDLFELKEEKKKNNILSSIVVGEELISKKRIKNNTF